MQFFVNFSFLAFNQIFHSNLIFPTFCVSRIGQSFHLVMSFEIWYEIIAPATVVLQWHYNGWQLGMFFFCVHTKETIRWMLPPLLLLRVLNIYFLIFPVAIITPLHNYAHVIHDRRKENENQIHMVICFSENEKHRSFSFFPNACRCLPQLYQIIFIYCFCLVFSLYARYIQQKYAI